MSKNIFLISYDISSNKNRLKAAKLLQQYGYERIQRSVFTGLVAPQRNKPLWNSLKALVDTTEGAEDKIICFTVSKTAFRDMKIIGIFTADTDYLLGLKHTEIF
jgi:CRISPR-associated endonuclease Cas2